MSNRRLLPVHPLLHVLIAILTLFLFMPEQGVSQHSLRLGPLLGYYMNRHTSGPSYAGEAATEHPFYPANSGSGETIGFLLQRNFNSRWSAGAGFAYNNLSGSQDSSTIRFVKIDGEGLYEVDYRGLAVDPNVEPPHEGHYAIVSRITYRTLSVSLSGQWRPLVDSSRCLGIDLGLVSHLVFTRNFTETLKLESPENGRFVNSDGYPLQNNGRNMLLYDGELSGSASAHSAIRGGIFAEFGDRDSDIIAVPGLYYEFGITPVQHNSDWRIHRLGVELALLFGL